jgi:hypothetical protein
MATKLLLVLSVFTIYTIEWVEKGLFSKSQLIFICEKSLKSSKIEIFKFYNLLTLPVTVLKRVNKLIQIQKKNKFYNIQSLLKKLP